MPGESEFGAKIVLQIGPSRLGIHPRDLQKLAAIEIVLNTANHGVCRNLASSSIPRVELVATTCR